MKTIVEKEKNEREIQILKLQFHKCKFKFQM